MSNNATRQLDQVTRIYKNSAGEVIAIHCLGIIEDRIQLIGPNAGNYPTLKERRSRSGKMNISLELLNLTMSQSRVIDKIQMIGKYDLWTLNGSINDIVTITYLGSNAEGGIENDLIFHLNLLPTVGDTI